MQKMIISDALVFALLLLFPPFNHAKNSSKQLIAACTRTTFQRQHQKAFFFSRNKITIVRSCSTISSLFPIYIFIIHSTLEAQLFLFQANTSCKQLDDVASWGWDYSRLWAAQHISTLQDSLHCYCQHKDFHSAPLSSTTNEIEKPKSEQCNGFEALPWQPEDRSANLKLSRCAQAHCGKREREWKIHSNLINEKQFTSVNYYEASGSGKSSASSKDEMKLNEIIVKIDYFRSAYSEKGEQKVTAHSDVVPTTSNSTPNPTADWEGIYYSRFYFHTEPTWRWTNTEKKQK